MRVDVCVYEREWLCVKARDNIDVCVSECMCEREIVRVCERERERVSVCV